MKQFPILNIITIIQFIYCANNFYIEILKRKKKKEEPTPSKIASLKLFINLYKLSLAYHLRSPKNYPFDQYLIPAWKKKNNNPNIPSYPSAGLEKEEETRKSEKKKKMFVFSERAYVPYGGARSTHRLVSNSSLLLPFLPADSEKGTGNGQDSGAK